jgi:MoxR-like ATPase
MADNYEDDFLAPDAFKEKLRKIPNCVRLRLNEPGKSANELTRTPGDEKQIEYKDHPIWHCKPDLDAYVKNKIGFTDEEVKRNYPSGNNIFYHEVAHEITKLRNSNTIVDWSSDVRTGVWRMRFSDNISSTPKTSAKTSSQINYFIIIQNPQSDYDDVPGKQYAYDSWKKYSSEFSEGTKFIVLSHIDKIDYFVGYGSVDKITSTPTMVNGRSQIRQLALFKDYVSFSPNLVRTNDVREKMLRIAYPNPDKSNIPPSMLPIPKKFYDEIIHSSMAPTRDYNSELPMLSTADIEEGYDLISKELLIPKEKIIEIITALLSGRHILLAGPIGTGKTALATLIPKIFWKRWGGYDSEIVTANSEWSTLDVIAGILPKMGDDGEPKYVIEPGCVVDTVRKNSQIHTNHSQYSSTPYMGTWLVIDEFNRANIDKAFGQLFTALRTRELKIPTDKVNVKYDHLPIQKDYRIIGTLNTADKHHLFNLSDALKSRFAYIELDIPKKGQREREIYFTMKNAIRELGLDESILKIFLVLDHNNKKIDKKTDDKFYARIFQAYEFLDTVRIFKKLGPAVLQLIYQNLITGVQLRIDNRTTLDTALTSTLIPQLENLESSSIGAIHAMHTDTLDSFFKDAYKDLNKLNYVETFETVLISLNVSDEDKNRIISKFENDTLPDDDGDWKIINDAFDKKKESIAIKLEHLSSALLDLKKSMMI